MIFSKKRKILHFSRQMLCRVAFTLLMAQSQAEQWQRWFDENGPRLLLFARGWSVSKDCAEDLVQETMLRLWHYQADRGGQPPDLPLAFSTIRFCGLNQKRTDSRRRKREEAIIYLNDFEDVWLDPTLEEDEEAALLRDAVQRLTPKLRDVITMKIWGNLTFQEIAIALAIPANTCASRYRYALTQLAQELQRIKEDRHEIA
jgi:RNA polymerase sigma-70 factor (ECF subfamily)